MKKLGTLILVLALLCTCLAGCGDGNVASGNDGYISDNGGTNNNGNNDGNILDPDGDGDSIIDPDDDDNILDPDDDDGMNESDTPTAIPNASPEVSPKAIGP